MIVNKHRTTVLRRTMRQAENEQENLQPTKRLFIVLIYRNFVLKRFVEAVLN